MTPYRTLTSSGFYLRRRSGLLPYPIRCISLAMIMVQLALPLLPMMTRAETVPATTSNGSRPFAVPPPEPVVTVNRTVPMVQLPTTDLRFSANPSDEEVTRARIFEHPIVHIGNKPATSENKDLAAALLAFRNRQNPDDAGAIENFIQSHPNSAWNISLTANLATHYRQSCQFSKALDTWKTTWSTGKDVTDINGRQVVDQAIGDWATFLITLGRMGELKALLQEVQGRSLSGAAAVRIKDAKSALWQMENRPGQTFKCGPYSISRIYAALNPNTPMPREVKQAHSTTNGTSLYQNYLLAKKLGLKYQMARRVSSDSAIPLPAMVHWKLGHFSALTSVQDGLYMIEDPTFAQGWISTNSLNNETDGYFLIPDGGLPTGWVSVTDDEAQSVFGRSSPTSGDPGAGGGGCGGGGSGGGYAEGGPNTTKCKKKGVKGMAQYAFNMMRIGLEIADIPIGYSPPRGPEVNFEVTYSEQTIFESGPFTHANLGNQWTFGWLTYVSDNTTQPTNSIAVIDNAGNSETYAGFNTTNQTYTVGSYSQGRMTKTSGNSYQCVYPDGSISIFSQPDNTNGARRVFITKVQDPQSNSISLIYDSNYRLTNVVDAIGQVTALSYGLTNDIYKITKVTDPFGRFATFQYNASGQLTNITDEIGITSAFNYGNAGGEADFINALTTPYGTTTFTNDYSYYTNFSGRWLLATDPLGGQERAEFLQSAPGINDLDPTNLIPSGLNTNVLLTGYTEESQRMSFFWNKATMLAMGNNIDFTKARQYLWDRSSSGFFTLSRTLEAVKQPMESARVWYNYPGQTESDQEGTMDTPTITARVLDDGTTQAQKYQYNAIGKPTIAIDPAGRTIYFNYATNLIDLLSASQLNAGTTNTLAQYTYNSKHLLLTGIDAAGNTNYFGYNASGQLTALTNVVMEIVLLNYNTNGYLSSIVAGTPGALLSTNSFTYDLPGRVLTATDTLGYTITTSYDNLDRPTNITYMDGTFENIVYDKLDAALMQDRNGHWTAQTHDQLRHLTDVYDFIGRHTQYDWCTCGSLASIVDPAGNVTQWNRDIQYRVTSKVYPDLTQVNYTYETNSSRLISVMDAKNQSTLYSYYIDNDLKQVSYSNAVVATPSVTFTYDTNYNRIVNMLDGTGNNAYNYYGMTNGQLGAGMLSSVSNSFIGSYITYNYDALGRITNRAINGVAEQLTYDHLDRVTIITNALGSFTNTYLGGTELVTTNFAPFGKITLFSYDGVTNDERLQEIWNQKTNGVTLSKFDYVYDALGQITNWTSQADATSTNVQVITYDPVNQLLSDTIRSNTVVGAILNQYAYAYDSAGNRTTEQIGTGNGGTTPVAMSQSTYSSDNQLTGRTGGSGQIQIAGSLSKQATVAVNGNITTVNHATTNFTGSASVISGTNIVLVIAIDYDNNSATNKYQIVVTNNGVNKTITFDANGNETSVATATSTNTYQWDAANRLVSITSPTNQSIFTYDGVGRRVQIIELTNNVPYATNKFVWVGMDISEQRNYSGSVIKRFFSQGEQMSGINYYFTKDHLGSIREMVDSSGTIQARYSYDPYGRKIKISGSLDADFAYTGFYYHSASGLYMSWLRSYDSDLARWLSRDPLAEGVGLNLYEYVANNPIDWVDPDGSCAAPSTFSKNSTITGGAGGTDSAGEGSDGGPYSLGDYAYCFAHCLVTGEAERWGGGMVALGQQAWKSGGGRAVAQRVLKSQAKKFGLNLLFKVSVAADFIPFVGAALMVAQAAMCGYKCHEAGTAGECEEQERNPRLPENQE
jgi:RHS repeat-associated protein